MSIDNHILVVEDDRTIRSLMVFGLKNLGYDLTPAQNGQEAMEILKTGTPSLILLDLYMPQMDGLRLLSWLRQEKCSDVPVIVVSAAEQEQDEIFRLGANAYLPKPVNLDFLTQKIQEYLPAPV